MKTKYKIDNKFLFGESNNITNGYIRWGLSFSILKWFKLKQLRMESFIKFGSVVIMNLEMASKACSSFSANIIIHPFLRSTVVKQNRC